MHLQLTWLCQCLLKLVRTSSPHCSDTSGESNVELARGAAADSWSWLWLLCHPELYRSGFATLKGENGNALRRVEGWAHHLWEKGQAWGDLTKFSHSAFCILPFPLSSLGKAAYIRCISALKQNMKSLVTLKLPFFSGQGACLQKHLMAQHECTLLNAKHGVYPPAKQACQIYNCD